MPWTSEDAQKHTSHANTPKKRRQWSDVANSALKAGHNEASAIRQANAAVHKMDEVSDITERVAKYLSINAPNIYEVMQKQLTAGDAHVTTALGNEEDEKKKKPKISVAYTQDDDELSPTDKHRLQKLHDEIDKAWTDEARQAAADARRGGGKSKEAGTHAYKGHLITHNALYNQYHISRDGSHIATTSSASEAHSIIDMLVGKAETDMSLKVVKIDPEQQKVFGWAFVSQRGDFLIVDKQGDIILPEDLELGAHDFALNSRSQGDMHNTTDGIPNRHGNMIESLVFTNEKLQKGISAVDPETGEQLFGWFVGFKVDDPQLWEAHKRGERPEFSIGGRGRRVDVDLKKKNGRGPNGSRSIKIIRHGATKLNNNDVSVDRIRGWADVPLSDDGRDEALNLANELKSDPPDVLVTSDLARALDTAKIISNCTGIPISMVSEGFRPWNVGMYSGEITGTAIPILADYARAAPDEQIPEGESFDTFRERFFETLAQVLDKFDGTIAIVTHHRGERLMQAWQAAGFPDDGSIDIDEFCQPGEHTGSITDMTIEPAEVQQAAAAAE